MFLIPTMHLLSSLKSAILCTVLFFLGITNVGDAHCRGGNLDFWQDKIFNVFHFYDYNLLV